MFLILGNAADPCCVQVNSVLKARGYETRVVEDIFSEQYRFMWRFATGMSLGNGNSRIGGLGEREAGGEIEGVLVRETGLHAVSDWSEKDAQYMAAETQAAQLGWIWSIPGVVINRLPAWLFLMPRPSFLAWVALLHRAGLRTPDMVISSDAQRLQDWRARHPNGSIFSPLSSPSHFQVQTETEWESVKRVSRHAPVLLEEAHGQTWLACVVGDRVVWDGAVPEEVQALEERLCNFARIAALDLVQVAVAEQPGIEQGKSPAFSVVSVEVLVQFPRFCCEAQTAIAEAIADLLTGPRKCDGSQDPVEVGSAAMSYGGAR